MNWINYYWDDGTDILCSSKTGTFVIDVSNIELHNNDVLEESIAAVKFIINSNPPPYRLLLSGGIDSQAMVYAWLKSGVDFEAHTFIYDEIMNNHDIHQLYEFSKEYPFSIETHKISHFEFLNHHLHSYSKKYNCNSPQLNFYMYMMDRFKDGTLVLSGNPPMNLTMWVDYSLHSLIRYQKINQRNLVPFFHIHTPKLAGSWVSKIRSQHFDRQELGSAGTNELKTLLYLDSGFPVLITGKKSGFEKYKIYFDSHTLDKKIRQKILLNTRNVSRRMYDILFRHSLELENPVSATTKIIGLDYNDKVSY